MSVGKLLGILLVIALIVGGVSYGMGWIRFDNGGVQLNSDEAAADATMDVYKKAWSQFQSLQYDKAFTTYTQALKDRPEDPEAATAYFAMGKCLVEMKRVPEAIEKYKTFLEKWPKDSRAATAQKEVDRLALMNQ